MSIPVTFAKKKSLYLPWQDAYEKIDESEASALLSDGEKLQAKGPEQSVPLPILSQQDLDEFQSFRHGEIVGDLADKQMAQDLLYLKNKGVKFSARFDKERRKVGAYGAYNSLSGQLGLSALQVVFNQSIPKASAEDSTKFKDIVAQVKMADKMTATSPEDSKEAHWSLLLKASLKYPNQKDELQLAKLAANFLHRSAWPKKGGELGVIRALYQDFMGPSERVALLDKVASAVDKHGDKQVRTLKSAVALYQTATDQKLSNQEFFDQVLSEAHASEVVYLGHAMAETLFPKELEKAKEFTQLAPDTSKARDQLVVLETLLKNPGVKERDQLTLLSLERLRSSGSNEETQLAFLDWATESISAANPRAKFAVDLSRTKNGEGESLLQSRSTRIGLLEESIKPENSELDFLQNTYNRSYKHDVGRLLEPLIKRVLPDMAQKVEEWTQFSHEETRKDHQYWLRRAIADNPEQKEPKELLAYVSEKKRSSSFVNKLYLSVVKSRSGESKAEFALKLNDGENSKLSYSESERAVSEAVLDPEVTMENLTEKLLEGVNSRDQASVRELALAELYPERFEVIKSLINFSDKEKKSFHFDYLCRAAASAKRDQSPAEMAAQAAELVSGSSHSDKANRALLYRLGAKHKAQTDSRARLFVETADSYEADGERQIKRIQSSTALYRAALDPSKTDKAVFDDILAAADDKDKRFIRKAIGAKFFPKIAKRVEELTDYSPLSAVQRHWDSLFETAYDNPDITNPGALVQKACSNIDSKDFCRALRTLALKKLSPVVPRAEQALSLTQDYKGNLKLNRWDSVDSLHSAALDPRLSDAEFLVNSVEGAGDRDKPKLLKTLGKDLLQSTGLEVPKDILARLDEGDLNAVEVKEVYETLKGGSTAKQADTEIDIEDDFIVIGDEALEVDL